MKRKQQIRAGFLTFLKRYFNPMTLRLAKGSVGPLAIIRHVGRRSGKSYETPIIIRPIDHGFVAELTYGPDVDWYKNVLAAGGCAVFWHGKDYRINRIETLDTESGMAAFPLPLRMILRLARRQHFIKLMMES